jgi:hypothetical protein
MYSRLLSGNCNVLYESCDHIGKFHVTQLEIFHKNKFN